MVAIHFMLYAEKEKRLQAVLVIVVLVTSGYKSTSEILNYICALMTVEKLKICGPALPG